MGNFYALISIHAPTKGATWTQYISFVLYINFNPRSHEGSDGSYKTSCSPNLTFQSTLPRRERPFCHSLLPSFEGFQSTLPRRERPYRFIEYDEKLDFNPRSHEGSDTGSIPVSPSCLISIHAPTKGATTGEFKTMVIPFISIHAPTKGATALHLIHKQISPSISIHAPTKGATKYNHMKKCWSLYFNPRSHEGSDKDDKKSVHTKPISIHAPTKGATSTYRTLFMLQAISIHAPTKGATIAKPCNRPLSGNFNPRSHEGSDLVLSPTHLQ